MFPAVKTRLVILGFLLLALDASACPRCTYDRLLAENWYIKCAIVSFVVPLLVVANRLDVVRVAFVFIPYAALFVSFHPYMLFHVFWKETLLAHLASWVYGLNLVGVGLLYLVSRFSFFRWNKDKGPNPWQPIAYAAAMFLAGQILILFR